MATALSWKLQGSEKENSTPEWVTYEAEKVLRVMETPQTQIQRSIAQGVQTTVQGTSGCLDGCRRLSFFALLHADVVLHRPVKKSIRVLCLSLLPFLAVALDPVEERYHLEYRHHLLFDLSLILTLASLEPLWAGRIAFSFGPRW